MLRRCAMPSLWGSYAAVCGYTRCFVVSKLSATQDWSHTQCADERTWLCQHRPIIDFQLSFTQFVVAFLTRLHSYGVVRIYISTSNCTAISCVNKYVGPRTKGPKCTLVTTALSVFTLIWELVAWHSGGTSVSDWRTFPVLRSTYSWWVTTNVGKPSATDQPTRPTQPFILSGSINEK